MEIQTEVVGKLKAFARGELTWAEVEGMTFEEAKAIAQVGCELAAAGRYEEARVLAYEPVKERDYFVNAGARLLRSYAGRPDRLKELDVMAYEEHDGPNGFAYREVESA